MITAKDLRGVLAIMPTPAKEGADRLDATNTVDLDETARLAEAWCATAPRASWRSAPWASARRHRKADYEAYVDCLLKTVRGRIPTFRRHDGA